MVLIVMPTQRIETLTWVLIFGGLVSASLGWFVTPQPGAWGELMIGGGIGGQRVC